MIACFNILKRRACERCQFALSSESRATSFIRTVLQKIFAGNPEVAVVVQFPEATVAVKRTKKVMLA